MNARVVLANARNHVDVPGPIKWNPAFAGMTP
jgi:hypothetical protein